MNARQGSGWLRYMNGCSIAVVGKLIGNPDLKRRGYEQQVRGRADIVIGEAQSLIKRCIKRV